MFQKGVFNHGKSKKFLEFYAEKDYSLQNLFLFKYPLNTI